MTMVDIRFFLSFLTRGFTNCQSCYIMPTAPDELDIGYFLKLKYGLRLP